MTNISKFHVDNLWEELKWCDQEKWYSDLCNDHNCINKNKVRSYRLYMYQLTTEQYVTAKFKI